MIEPVTVTLSAMEMMVGVFVGGRRRWDTVINERTPTREQPQDRAGWSDHILGAHGEMAVAQILGIYWPFSVDTFRKIPDLGDNFEVKASARSDRSTVYVPKDVPDGRVVIFVTGIGPDFEIPGWMVGKEGKTFPDDDLGYKNRPKVHLIPKSRLNSVMSLKKK